MPASIGKHPYSADLGERSTYFHLNPPLEIGEGLPTTVVEGGTHKIRRHFDRPTYQYEIRCPMYSWRVTNSSPSNVLKNRNLPKGL